MQCKEGICAKAHNGSKEEKAEVKQPEAECTWHTHYYTFFIAVISYEGKTLEELIKDCNEIVYEYLEDCKSQGIKPQKLKRTKKIIE